MTSTFGLNC